MNIFSLNLRPALIIAMAVLMPVASVSFLGLASMGELEMLSEKDLVHAWRSMEPESARPLYYLNYLPVSARFYTQGQVIKIDSAFTDLLGHGFWLELQLAVSAKAGNI